MKFASDYYMHYPKVAFGHWPPLFYAVQSFWMMLFTASRASVRLEIALTTACLAFSVWHVFRRLLGEFPALLGSALLICLPLVQESTDQEMAESLLALCCFWSTIYFGRFLDSDRPRDALLFGLFFALTVLTKGSGWLLVFVPVLSLLLTRKLRLLKSKNFWLGLLLAAVLCVPWQVLTLRSAERGWSGGSHPSVGYTLNALWRFLFVAVGITGPILMGLVVVGLAIAVIIPVWRRPIATSAAVLFALLVGDWVFHSLVPAGVENRKMIMAVPALIYFLLAGGMWLVQILPPHDRFNRWKAPGLIAVVTFAFFTTVFTIPRDYHYGYEDAARYLLSDPHRQPATILVSSGSIGEGLLVSEIAMRQPRPKSTILRATKTLAHIDWAGSHYQSVYQDCPSLLRYFHQAHVDDLVIDTFASSDLFPHEKLVKKLLHDYSRQFRLRGQFPGMSNAGERGTVQVYEVLPPRPAA